MPTEGSEAIAGTAAKPATEPANAVKVAMVDEEHGDAMGGPSDRDDDQGHCCQGGNGGQATIALTMTLSNTNDTPRKGPRDFVVDNAATCGHISTRLEHFFDLNEFPVDKRPTIGGIGPQRVQIHGRGDIKIRAANGKSIILQNAS